MSKLNLNIPLDWKFKNLEEIATVTGGKRLPKGEALIDKDSGHPYIRVANMKQNGLSQEDILYVPSEIAKKLSRYIVSSGDIYISVAGTLGLVGIVPKEFDGANLTENANRISNINCDTRFLLYVLKSNLVQSYVNREKTTNAQPKLALTRIKKFAIPIPKEAEQQKIAAILSSVDQAIEKTEQIINQTEKVKQGLMQQLLTKGIGHTKFKETPIGEIPKEWEVSTIQSHLLESKSGASLKSNEFTESGIKVLPKKAVNSNGLFNTADIDIAFTSEEIAENYSNSFVNKSYLITVLRDLVPSGPNIGRIIKIVDEDSYLIA